MSCVNNLYVAKASTLKWFFFLAVQCGGILDPQPVFSYFLKFTIVLTVFLNLRDKISKNKTSISLSSALSHHVISLWVLRYQLLLNTNKTAHV